VGNWKVKKQELNGDSTVIQFKNPLSRECSQAEADKCQACPKLNTENSEKMKDFE
jgi:hypothetical protein